MIYRVLRNLSTGHKKGDVVDGDQFKALPALLKARALAEVTTPPLAELPGWKLRAEKLATAGVMTVQDFLDADEDKIVALFGRRRKAELRKWQEEARGWLTVGTPGAGKK